MHLRSAGPIKEVVTLSTRFKTNAKYDEKIKLVDVNCNVATVEVEYNWVASATQHKQYEMSMKQFDNPTLAEARLRDDWPLWKKAIEKEFKQLEERGTWKEVNSKDVVKRPLGTKLVLKIKRDARTNEIEKYKARLTVKGYRQVKGYDYQLTTSPVTVYATFLFLMAHAVRHNRLLMTMDFAGAFLYAYLNEDIYITLPELYKLKKEQHGKKKLLKLLKTLYGLKQASREWYLAVTKALKEIGFVQAPIELDQCLLFHEKYDIYLCLHVDDCFMSYTDENKVKQLVKQLEEKNFEFSIVEELKKGLGLSIKRDGDEIIISQPQYVDFILDEFKDDLVKTNRKSRTPISKLQKDRTEDEDAFDTTLYRSLLGCLGHLARMTRPDIIQAVFHLAQFAHNPSEKHWKALCGVVDYLSFNKDIGIRFCKNGKLWIFYVDADWGGCPSTRRSTSGYLIKYCEGPLIAVSRRQRNVTLSSTEAEYCAFTDVAKDIIWTKRLAEFFKEDFPKPAVLLNDNVTAQNLANGEMTLNRTKHIDALSKHSGIRYHWIRELIIAGLIELKHVSSLNNESDLFTKPLGSTIHERLKTKVMNIKTDENEPTKETSSNFSMNYEFTTSIDDKLKSLIFTNGI